MQRHLESNQESEPGPELSGPGLRAPGGEAVVRLLAERELGRPGCLTSLWPLLLLPTFFTLLVGTGGDGWSWFWLSLAALLTTRKLARQSAELAAGRAVLLTPELDGAWLGALVEALEWPDTSVRLFARMRLTALLPSISKEDAARLPPLQMAALYDHLTWTEAACYPDFVLALLQAARRLRHVEALRGMESLARMRVPTGALRRVRRVARACLPELEAAAAITPEAASETARQATVVASSTLNPEARQWLEAEEGRQRRQPTMRLGFLLASYVIIVPYLAFQAANAFQQRLWPLGVLCSVLAMATTQLYRFTLTRDQQRLADRLARMEDVRAIGQLAEIQAWPDARMARMARAGLIRLLPQMQAGDARLLDVRQRAFLYQRLRLSEARANPEFLLAILKALEQIGDTDAVPYVEALAHSEPPTLRERQVKQAAEECLPYLLECAQHNRDSQVLLRASAGSEPPERLLRPLRPSTAPESERLLRTSE